MGEERKAPQPSEADVLKRKKRLEEFRKKKKLNEYIQNRVWRLGRCEDLSYAVDMEVKEITEKHNRTEGVIKERIENIDRLVH
jgi:uncharacterized membrane protein